jgi:CheY-like chemotaxis protein
MNKKTILVVEDDGLIALHLTEILEKAGYQIIGPADSGEMALHLLKKGQKPDLVLMDIGLSGEIDGIETARQIRRHCAIPLVFLTAYSSDRTLERMREVSTDGYIVKPFLAMDLLNIVRKNLEPPAA